MPQSTSWHHMVSICVVFPDPSIPEKLIRTGWSQFVRRESKLIGIKRTYFAPGGFGPLALVSAVTVPRATPAPAMTPILIKIERTCRCLAGSMAAPAGREAALPLTLPACAAAVPDGCTVGGCGCWVGVALRW